MSSWKSHAGKMSDREISRCFEISASTVRRFREASKIPQFSREDTALPSSLIARLTEETNYRLAKAYGISIKRLEQARAELKIAEPRTIRERFKPLEDIWTIEAITLLGLMPDTEIAGQLGISNFPVKRKRKELGIEAYKRPLPKITPQIASQFGSVSDAVLARRLGVSANYIRIARIK